MATYTLPSVRVFQDFRQTLATPIPTLNALLVGPQYDYLKYSDSEDKESSFVGLYDKDIDQTIDYPGRIVGDSSSVVKQDDVQVYFDDIEAEYFTHVAGAGPYEFRTVASHVNRITTDALLPADELIFKKFTNSAGTVFDRSSVFNERDVSELDVVEVTGVFPGPETVTHRSGIREFINDVIAAVTGAATADGGNQATVAGSVGAATPDGGNAGDDTATSGGTYAGSLADDILSDTYTVEIITGGAPGVAEFSVDSASGTDDVAAVTVTAFGAAHAVGTRGVTITFTDGGDTVLTAGDKWTIAVVKAIDAVLATSGGTYTGKLDATYTVEVTKGGTYGNAQITVTSTATDSSGPTTVTAAATNVSVGTKNVVVQFAANTQNGLVLGDKWTIVVTSEKKGAYKTIVLEDRLPQEFLDNVATDLTATFYLVQDDVPIPRYRVDVPSEKAWVEGEDSVEIKDTIKITDSSWFDNSGLIAIPVDKARMHVTYRALRTGAADAVQNVSADVEDIEDKLGRIDVLNPIAFAASKCIENSAGTAIKILTLVSDDRDGYKEAAAVLKDAQDIYAIVPLTQDPLVHQDLQAHVQEMSVPQEGRWRILLVNRALTTQEFLLGEKPILNSTETEDYLAKVVDDPLEAGTIYNLLEASVTQDINFIDLGVQAGDIVQTNFQLDINGETVWDEVEVLNVISSTTLKLAAGLDNEIPIESKFRIYRKLSKDEQVDRLVTAAESIKDRRVFLIWPDQVGVGGLVVSGYYLAASIAGMIAALPPHQGFTNLQILGWDDLSRSFIYFKKDQLDELAGSGIYIVTQKSLGAAPYARHQLSTDMSSLQFRELNITKNVDSISYFYKNLLDQFIGVYTVNDQTIETIYATMRSGSEALKAQVYPRIGAQLIDANVLSIQQDPVFADQIRVDNEITVPAPLNNLDLHLII